tara:strand:+ start:279 stop:593 length:315 start_codon:yes stop_codon:yes gene_type:complete
MKKKPTISQYIDGVIGILILGSIILFITACSSTVILPGICYNDRDGTYICPESYPPKQERDMEELEPLYKACEDWELHSGEAWMQCIMNEERRRNLLERSKNLA